ncbi:WPP domain-interacting protein 2 isoform X2 [Durio zibethinus]|nr:WPP domain-interacting protein 2 isoform X2 [Durio zibethinus]
MDSSKLLKRGLSGSANPTKPQHMASPEIKQNSEPPFGPVNVLKNASVAHGFMMHSPSSDSRFAVGPAYAAAADSENSEDQSSKSSTAASMPKVRYEQPAIFGYEKSQMNNLGGKTVGNSSQRVQQGNGHVESSKKLRGERVKIEMENSHSSMESDSRSSDFVFMQGSFSVTSNRKQSGNSMNYDRENGDEAHEGEDQISEEVQTAYKKENSGDIEELSADDLPADLSWEAKEEKSENHCPSPYRDPLVESILALQSAQEALENEVKKLGEIGKEPTSLHDDSVNINSVHEDSTYADQEILETSTSDQLSSERIRKSTSGSLETQVFTLTHKVKYLESKLEEARAVLQAKESRISELETSVNSSRSQKEESGSTAELQQDKYREMEFDFECLFQQKMKAEIEFLALTRAIQKLRDSAGNQSPLLKEQTSLAGEQAQMLNKLGEADSEAAMPKKQADELEKYCGDVLGTEEVLKMQRRVCKVTLCFFTQLVLLVLVFLFVVLQLSTDSGVVVPT